MELNGVERASARTEELCPASFGAMAKAIDELEAMMWDTTNGYNEADLARLAQMEGQMRRHRPLTGSDWEWLAKRLGRAVANDWAPGFINPLVRLAGAA